MNKLMKYRRCIYSFKFQFIIESFLRCSSLHCVATQWKHCCLWMVPLDHFWYSKMVSVYIHECWYVPITKESVVELTRFYWKEKSILSRNSLGLIDNEKLLEKIDSFDEIILITIQCMFNLKTETSLCLKVRNGKVFAKDIFKQKDIPI